MSTSPSMRFSLRRKRSTRSGENSGSPAIKKNSPTLPEAKKESPSTPKSHKLHRPNNRPSRSGSRSSPQRSRVKSRKKDDNEEKNLQTPATVKWTHPDEDSLRQPSPDMPFISSQLCSTQECEVVWDCDSPGFTKDDLKRMHSGRETELPDRPVQITQLPHRQLFPLTRSRASRASTSSNTTAQLNDLLDFLSNKEHAGRREKEKVENPNSHHKSLQHIVPPKGSFSEDGSSSESQALLEPLMEASTQPFEVAGASGLKESDQNLPSDIDDSIWGDDLNLGMCDLNDSALTEQGSSKTSSKGARVASKEADRSRLPQETSTDIFDDDLFSDSVILSTQAVEEAMTKKDTKDITNDRNYSCDSSFKETQHRSNKTLLKDGCQYQEKDSVKNVNGNCNKPEVNAHKVITNSSTTSSRIIPSVNMKQINTNSNNSPQRQVRRSFKFGPSPKTVAKKAPSLVTGKGNQLLTSVPGNQELFRNRDARGVLRKTDPLPVLRTEKSSMQNSSSSHLMPKSLSRVPGSCNNLNTQMTKAPVVRKSLFRSNNTKSEEIKQRNNIQASRGPLLRSQSSGDTRITTSSPVGRRSNSSVELDASQDLDDDEFFKSLLSMLPEEEGGFSATPGVSLSPIKPENQSSHFQKSANPSTNMKHNTGNRVEARDSRFNKREACIVPPQNRSKVPPQNLKNAPTQNQCNVFASNHKVPSQNLSRIPSQNLINVPSLSLCNVPSQNIRKVLPQNLKNVPPQKTHNALHQSLTNAPPHNFVNGSIQTTLERKVKQGVTKPQLNPSGKRPVQGVRPPGSSSATRSKPLDTNKARVGDNEQQQTSDTFDDGLFEDDVLSLIDEVESQFGSQNTPSEPSPSPQSSQPQQVKCSQDEIARKKAAALQRREERRQQRR